MAISDAVRQIGVTEPTYYRWRQQYGGMNRDQLKRLKELETENQRLRRAVSDLTLDREARAATGSRLRRTILSGAARGTAGPRSETSEPFAPSPVHRACAADFRHIRAPGLPHPWAAPLDANRKVSCGAPDEDRLTEDIIALARTFGRYGDRMITGLLNNAGWHVNHKRVERLWRREGRETSRKSRQGRVGCG